MLLGFVIAYWIISVLIGLYAATRVHNTKDFAIAGRHLPFYMVVATVFATWFGSEAVLGIPASFLQDGLSGIVADPFGSSICLILVGLLFAAPLYRMNLLTIGDFYKKKYGRSIEVLTTIAIVISYLGWVSAQITALGLVFNVVSGGEISQLAGMWIGASTILIYTYFGGMWAVAITDLLQMAIIIIGMLLIGNEVSEQVGGVSTVVQHAAAAGKFEFFPELDFKAIITFVATLVTMMLGSIPQQDVFQRVQSARTIKIAVWGSVLGGVLYFLFTFVPIFLAYSATMIDPAMVEKTLSEGGDSQLILPNLVLQHAPLWIQILFFGALLSAIKSCASATLLAPSVTFSENILRPMLKHRLTDRQQLNMMRVVTLVFTVLVTLYAMYSMYYSHATIYTMVENAYQVTLVMAFVPLAAGVYWKRANTQGALTAIACGVSVWLGCSIFVPDDYFIPPHFAGLIASIIGMIVGALLPNKIAKPLPQEPDHATLHHHAASVTGHVPTRHGTE
ncbi:MAG: sodium:solute symporter family protein [Methylobacillus sp.]|jgi:Na+/proline symporter|nr:sodium:solute symporter family protein [Methylobacillus sp.]